MSIDKNKDKMSLWLHAQNKELKDDPLSWNFGMNFEHFIALLKM